MPQTSVADPAVGFAGQLADSAPHTIDSFVSEEASAEIPFGRMVGKGTSDSQALLLVAQADTPVGVVAHSHAYAKDTELGSTGLKPNVTLAVLQKGRIWVTVADAVNPGDPVRYSEAGGTWQTAASAGVTVNCSPFARWLTSAGAGGLAMLEIDMTGSADRTSD